MPPRIRVTLPVRRRCFNASPLLRSTNLPTTSTLNRTINSQNRSASILASISDVRSAYQKPIRRGRGPSSGKGKTSGRGHKGQKQHGKVPRGFEGGQTPLRITHGVRGFKNVFSVDMQTVPLSRIHSWVAQGRIDPLLPITVRELAQSRCVSSIKDGVKLLANSNSHTQSIDPIAAAVPQTPLHIVVSRASAAAIAAVEKDGGSVTTRYYTRWAIQKIRCGKMDPMYSLQSLRPSETPAGEEAAVVAPGAEGDSLVPFTPAPPSAEPALPRRRYKHRLPDATSRKDIEYYRDPAHRGYLSYTVAEGRWPSLFFRTPEESRLRLKALATKGGGGKKVNKSENLLW